MMSFDERGNTVREDLPNGGERNCIYDERNFLVCEMETSPDSATHSLVFGYDDRENLIYAISSSGHLSKFFYNEANELTDTQTMQLRKKDAVQLSFCS